MTADTYDGVMFNRYNVKGLMLAIVISVCMWVAIILLLDKLWDQFT